MSGDVTHKVLAFARQQVETILAAPLEPLPGAVSTLPGDQRPLVLHVLPGGSGLGPVKRSARLLSRSLINAYRQLLVYPGRARDPECDVETRPGRPIQELVLNSRMISPATHLCGAGADLSCPHAEKLLARLIRTSGASIVHFHHLRHWDSLLLPLLATRLGCKTVVTASDLDLACPIPRQIEYVTGEPCGLPHADADARCVTCLHGHGGHGRMPDNPGVYLAGRKAIVSHMLDAADAVVVPSAYLRQRFMRTLTQPPDRIHVIPHAAEIPGRVPNRAPRMPVRLGYFGGASRIEGAALVIRLGQLLSPGTVRIRIHGRCDAFRPAELATNVELYGPYVPEELPQCMAAIDMVLIPSRFEEPFGQVVSEAMAHGVPVLASGRGALAERVQEGVNGWIERSEDPHAWAARINALISDGQLQSIDRRDLQERTPSLADVAASTDELYQSLLAGSV